MGICVSQAISSQAISAAVAESIARPSSDCPLIQYEAPAVEFDGTNDYLNRGTDLIGNADGTLGIFSGWFNSDLDTTLQYLYGNTSGTSVIYLVGNKFRGQFRNPSFTTVQSFATVNTYSAASGWHHVLMAWDTGAANIVQMYVDDVSDITRITQTADTIDYTHARHSIGSSTGASKFSGCMSDIYINTAEYLDISIEANRRKFISSSLKPVDLGDNGELPTTNSPIMFFKGDFSNFEINLGTGGAFTQIGALANCPDSPSD